MDIELAQALEENAKAKEIIRKLKALYFSPVVTKDDVKRQDKILAEAERFLIESDDRFEVTEKGKEYLGSH